MRREKMVLTYVLREGICTIEPPFKVSFWSSEFEPSPEENRKLSFMALGHWK
jgi:hypothetical protein